MDITLARSTIIRKFTNYRSDTLRKTRTVLTENELEMDSLKQAAIALVDMKSFSKGRALFKKRNEEKILAKRDAIHQKEGIPQIAAFQKALRILWDEADQDFWETQAIGEVEDIHE